MLNKLKQIAGTFRSEFQVYRLCMKHEQTGRCPRFLLWLAVGYVLLPFDLIPDFIPILGQLDDAVLVPLLVLMALKMIPTEVISECRSQVNSTTEGAR